MFFARGAALSFFVSVLGAVASLSGAADDAAPLKKPKAPRWTGQRVVDVDGQSVHVRRLDLPGDTSFVFQAKALGEAQKDMWNSLSNRGQSEFVARRQRIIESLAQALTQSELVWGVGKITKDWVMSVATRTRVDPNPIEEFVAQARLDGLAGAQDLSSLRARSRATVQDLLSLVDRELWTHQKLVSESNEIGMTLIADVGVGALWGRKGLYGAVGLGVTFAYNHDAKGVVFEVFHDLEKGVRGLPVIAQAAVCLKCLAHVASQDPTDPSLAQVGRSVYPPGPVASLDSPMFIETGLSHGIGVPPFDAIYAMEGRFHRGTWLRFATSKLEGSPHVLVDSIVNPSRLVALAKIGRGLKGCLNFVTDMFRLQ